MSATTTVLPEQTWRAAASDHAAQVDAWTQGRLERRMRHEKHPIDDFLWEYYPFSPGKLRRWHPGPGVALEGRADSVLEIAGYIHRDGHTVFDLEALTAEQRQRLRREHEWTTRLFRNVAGKPGRFGCFGLHEWAMVLGQSADEVRHAGWPLRVDPQVIRQTINDVGLRCTHFDAFRFFTPEAIPLNPNQNLNRALQPDMDQAGCLHANMDLYKWSMRLQPLVPMDFVRKAFALARDVRVLDMQGAPYDLAALGVVPIRLETAEGRAEFARQQRAHAERASELRAELLGILEASPL